MNDCLLIRNKWFNVCVWFFFFLSNDVSTFQKINIVKINEWMSKIQEKKIDDWLSWSIWKNIKIVYWLTDWLETKKSIIDSFRRHENVLCKFFIQFTKIRSVISWFFQKIWVERQMNNIHRFQKKNFFINANSRSFSLIHDAHNENEMHSSFSKKKFQTNSFLLTRVFLRMIRRFSFDLRIFTNDSTIFFNYSRIFTNIFDDFILFIRVFRRATH